MARRAAALRASERKQAVLRLHGARRHPGSRTGWQARYGRRRTGNSGLRCHFRNQRPAAAERRSQRAGCRQSLLHVGRHGHPALQQTMVARGRVRAHLELRPGKRIFRADRPPEHLSAHAKRSDQRGKRRRLRVPDLVGQDLRDVQKGPGTCGSRHTYGTNPVNRSVARSRRR